MTVMENTKKLIREMMDLLKKNNIELSADIRYTGIQAKEEIKKAEGKITKKQKEEPNDTESV